MQQTLGFIHIKAALGLQVAVNEKSQRHYTQLSASKRAPQTGTVCFITTYTYAKGNRVEPFSISFPPSVEFCFTSQMLKILDTSFYNVDLT